MKAEEQIGCDVDSWIREEDVPTRANLTKLKAVNPAFQGIN